MHQVRLENKVVKHYANNSLGKQCFMYLIELYISKLGLFYCKPETNVMAGKSWYYDMLVGHNPLRS